MKYSDDGTVYSHTTQTRIPIPFEERNTPNKGTPSSKSSLSMHQVTKKLFSGIGFGSVVSDDADVKVRFFSIIERLKSSSTRFLVDWILVALVNL